jgi:hypothetical protein
MEETTKIVSLADLNNAIRLLEEKRQAEGRMVKDQFEVTFESVKPINLIKSTIKEVVSSPELKGNAINTSVGLAAGFVSKAVYVGFSASPVRKLVGTLLMFGITNLITRRGDMIGRIGRKLIAGIRRNKLIPPDNQLPEGNK